MCLSSIKGFPSNPVVVILDFIIVLAMLHDSLVRERHFIRKRVVSCKDTCLIKVDVCQRVFH